MSTPYTQKHCVSCQRKHILCSLLLRCRLYPQCEMLVSPAVHPPGKGPLRTKTLKNMWKRWQELLKATAPQRRHRPAEWGLCSSFARGNRGYHLCCPSDRTGSLWTETTRLCARFCQPRCPHFTDGKGGRGSWDGWMASEPQGKCASALQRCSAPATQAGHTELQGALYHKCPAQWGTDAHRLPWPRKGSGQKPYAATSGQVPCANTRNQPACQGEQHTLCASHLKLQNKEHVFFFA